MQVVHLLVPFASFSAAQVGAWHEAFFAPQLDGDLEGVGLVFAVGERCAIVDQEHLNGQQVALDLVDRQPHGAAQHGQVQAEAAGQVMLRQHAIRLQRQR